MSLTHPRKAAGAAVIAVLAALAAQASLATGAAQASTLVHQRDRSQTLDVWAQSGKLNTITVTSTPGVTTGSPTAVTRSTPASGAGRSTRTRPPARDYSLSEVYVEGADLNDTVTVSGSFDTILDGGSGTDVLNAAAATGWNELLAVRAPTRSSAGPITTRSTAAPVTTRSTAVRAWTSPCTRSARPRSPSRWTAWPTTARSARATTPGSTWRTSRVARATTP